jgi:hypothetical protein
MMFSGTISYIRTSSPIKLGDLLKLLFTVQYHVRVVTVVEHKEIALWTFLDTQGAFDRTLFEAIAKDAERHGVEVHYSQVGLHYSVKQKHNNYTIQKNP